MNIKYFALLLSAFVLLDLGSAQNCPSICPAIYRPVCGFNGSCYRNFGSACMLSGAACSGQGRFNAVSDGPCTAQNLPNCD